MKKLFTVIIGAIALLGVLVIAVCAYVATIDPNDYKDYISGRIEQDTGRRISLNGDIGLTLYPWLGLEINDVTIDNPGGFGDVPFVHVDYAQLRVKTVPMFRNRFEIDTVQVHGAEINLARNNANQTNWEDLSGGAGPGTTNREPTSLDSFVIGGVDIQDVTITWRDDIAGNRVEVSKLNVATGELVYGQPIDLRMSLAAAANKPAINGDLQLTGTVAYDTGSQAINISPLQVVSNINSANIPGGSDRIEFAAAVALDFAAETAAVTGMTLSMLGMQASGEVQAAKFRSAAPTVSATLDISGTDLSLLFKVAEIEPLATQIARLGDRKFNIRTRLDADIDRGDINIPEVTADLLGASIRGQVTAANVQSDKRSVRGELTASGPDLPTLLQVAGQFQGGDDPALRKYGAQLAGIPTAQKAFSAEVYFDADMAQGNINVPTLSLNALGVTAAGNLKATQMQDKNGTVDGRLDVTGSDLARVLTAVEQQSLAEVLQRFNLKTTISGTRSNVNLKPLNFTATFAGEQIPNSPVDLALNADTRINLDDEQLNLDNFTVQGLGLNVRGNLSATDIRNSARFQGELNVDEFNLRRLIRQLNMEVPDTADKMTLRKVALNTRFNGSRSNLAISSLDLKLDDTSVQGKASVTDFEKPASEFELVVDAINADRYLPPPVEDKTARQAQQPASDIPVETIRSLNTRGSVRISDLILSKARMTDIQLNLTGKNGIVKLDPTSASMYGGRYTGDVTLDTTGKLPRLTVNSKLSSVQIEPLLADVTGKHKLRGTGNFSAALFAVGNNSDVMKQNLNGQTSFSFHDGAIIGFNLGKIMRMGNQLKETMTLKVSEQEETDFTEITGNPVITNGIVTLDDLSAKSPALRLSGQGIISDLNKNTLDYTISARIVATSKGQGGKDITEGKLEGVPLDCRFSGSLDSPKRSCDATKLIAALGLKIVEGIVKLPTKVVPGSDGSSAVGDLLNKLPIGNRDTQEQTTTEEQQPETNKEVEETVKKAEDLIKGIFGR